MSILDTTAYFKGVYTQEHIPFEDQYRMKPKNDRNDNFCPKCHYNYHSHYHKTHCEGDPLSLNGDFILLFFGLIYLIIKIKLWKRY